MFLFVFFYKTVSYQYLLVGKHYIIQNIASTFKLSHILHNNLFYGQF